MKELTLEFEDLCYDLIENLDRKEDSWIFIKLIKKFIPDIRKQKESYDEIFEAIAKNPNTPLEMMKLLIDFENDEVRENLALNPSLTKKLIMDLANDESYYVRYNLLQRVDLDEDIIRKLFETNNNIVNDYYFDEEDDEDDEYYDDYDSDEREKEIFEFAKFLGSRDIDDESNTILDGLTEDLGFEEDMQEEFYRKIAANPGTPVDILEKLSEHFDYEVRSEVAKNPKTTFKILEKLSLDGSDSVKAAILKRNDKDLRIKLLINNHVEWVSR